MTVEDDGPGSLISQEDWRRIEADHRKLREQIRRLEQLSADSDTRIVEDACAVAISYLERALADVDALLAGAPLPSTSRVYTFSDDRLVARKGLLDWLGRGDDDVDVASMTRVERATVVREAVEAMLGLVEVGDRTPQDGMRWLDEAVDNALTMIARSEAMLREIDAIEPPEEDDPEWRDRLQYVRNKVGLQLFELRQHLDIYADGMRVLEQREARA